MQDPVLLLSLLFVVVLAAYTIRRAVSPPALPSRLEDEGTKKHLALLFAFGAACELAHYSADREDTLALVVGLALIGGAVHAYLRPATGSLPDEERFWDYRHSAVVAVIGVATIVLMTAIPAWSDAIIAFWLIAGAAMLTCGIAQELLRRRRR